MLINVPQTINEPQTINCLICKSPITAWNDSSIELEYKCRNCILGTEIILYRSGSFSYRLTFIKDNSIYILSSGNWCKPDKEEYTELKSIARNKDAILRLHTSIAIDRDLSINEQMNKIIKDIFNMAVFA